MGTPPVNTMRYGTSTFVFYAEISTKVLNYVNPFKINVKSAPANTKIVFKVDTIFYKINNAGQLQTVTDLFGTGNTVAEINAKASISCLKGKQFQIFFLAPGENPTVLAELCEYVERTDIIQFFTELKTNIQTLYNEFELRVKQAPAGSKISIQVNDKDMYKLGTEGKLSPTKTTDEGTPVDDANKIKEVSDLRGKKFRVYVLAPGQNASVLIKIKELKNYIIEWFRDKEAGK